jgi:hypothetical protein
LPVFAFLPTLQSTDREREIKKEKPKEQKVFLPDYSFPKSGQVQTPYTPPVGGGMGVGVSACSRRHFEHFA